MSKKERAVLVTGAAGEIGQALVRELIRVQSEAKIVALDLNPGELAGMPGVVALKGSVTDTQLLDSLFAQYQIEEIFHLAALLSTSGERNPELAFEVNVTGSMALLTRAQKASIAGKKSVKFIFPSTIAVYGISRAAKGSAGRVKESEHLDPITMYGVNKLSVEQLGRYLADHYRFLDSTSEATVDFRALRFPGILSAESVPSGGTSDYGPEIIHAAAQGKSYACFVEPEATLPFMVMPDAVGALVELANADGSRLKQRVYNVTSFSISAAEFKQEVERAFGTVDISFRPHPKRAEIVASWPADIDDKPAQLDWDWKANFDRVRAFSEYLIPAVRRRYGSGQTGGNHAGSDGSSVRAKGDEIRECANQ